MKITEDDLNTASLIEVSFEILSIEVNTEDAMADFFEDDGGY